MSFVTSIIHPHYIDNTTNQVSTGPHAYLSRSQSVPVTMGNNRNRGRTKSKRSCDIAKRKKKVVTNAEESPMEIEPSEASGAADFTCDMGVEPLDVDSDLQIGSSTFRLRIAATATSTPLDRLTKKTEPQYDQSPPVKVRRDLGAKNYSKSSNESTEPTRSPPSVSPLNPSYSYFHMYYFMYKCYL
jgi:hypothetical protein